MQNTGLFEKEINATGQLCKKVKETNQIASQKTVFSLN